MRILPKQPGKTGEKTCDWMKIEFFAPIEMIDALNNFMEELGAQGAFQETLEPLSSFGKDPIKNAPALAPPSGEILKAFLPFDVHLEQRLAALQIYIDSLTELFPELEKPGFRTEIIRDPDWGEAWKKYFKPLRVSRNIIIKPTWESFSPVGREIVIEIDPGMAFGTGQHPSTRMCLEAIDKLLLSEQLTEQWSILDVGTGTGILGIACAKLGARRVLCVDNDEQATEIAQENVLINRVEERVTVTSRDVAELTEPFDLVVANLTAKILIEFYPDLVRLVKPGGYLVISGIIEQNKPDIETRFLSDSFPIHHLITEKEWVCYLLKKAGEHP